MPWCFRRKDNKRIVCWLKEEGEIPEGNDISSILFKIIANRADVESLTNKELIELGLYINQNENLSSFNFYQGSKDAVLSITGKYKRLVSKGLLEESKEYAEAKRQSLVNIFGKTYIPNLKHQVELKYIEMIQDEKTGLIDFVNNID